MFSGKALERLANSFCTTVRKSPGSNFVFTPAKLRQLLEQVCRPEQPVGDTALDVALDTLGIADSPYRLPCEGLDLLEKLTKHWEDEISFKGMSDPELIKDVNAARTYLDFGKNNKPVDQEVCEEAEASVLPSASVVCNQYNSALNYALDHLDSHEAREFLELWREGCWPEIAEGFPDFPGLVTIKGMLKLSDNYAEVKGNG